LETLPLPLLSKAIMADFQVLRVLQIMVLVVVEVLGK
jgi:hypothetical protein